VVDGKTGDTVPKEVRVEQVTERGLCRRLKEVRVEQEHRKKGEIV
jgi:hypothetical protein